VGVLSAASGALPRALGAATLRHPPDEPDPAGAATLSEVSGAPHLGSAAPAAPLDFEQVYQTQLDFVWRSLRLLGVPPEAVEDATQDVFGIVSRQLAHFEGRSALRTWLFAILQRVASNQRRTARRKLRQLQPFVEEAAGLAPTPHAHAEAAEAMDIVQSFCETLDLDRRAVFVLSLLEELPAAEVSVALGIPVNTVYSRVRSLREGLRRRLEEREVEHG
jgi:RNA polymerase sigma-70 factor (ECF subfamily)